MVDTSARTSGLLGLNFYAAQKHHWEGAPQETQSKKLLKILYQQEKFKEIIQEIPAIEFEMVKPEKCKAKQEN